MAKKKRKTQYAHNPGYCMIYPDADDRDDGVVSTGQS